MPSHISSVAWRRKCCIPSIGPSAASLRYLCISSIRLSNEQISVRSARTQDTTEELAQIFDQSDRLPQDVRKLQTSLPNAPFRRSPRSFPDGQANPQTQSNPRSIFRYDNARGKPAEAQPSGQIPQPISAPDRYHSTDKPPPKVDTSSEAESPPRLQRTNRPFTFIRYDNTRQESPTASQRSFTRPPRPLPAGAVDARNLGASPGPNGPVRRPSPNETNPNRSPRAGSGMPRPGIADAARQKAPRGPRGRDRTVTSSERLDPFGARREKFTIPPEEEKYIRERDEKRKPKAVTYVPAAVDLESLSGTGPALPVLGIGAWGQEEAVADWVEEMGARSRSMWKIKGVQVERVEAYRGWVGEGATARRFQEKKIRKRDAEAKAGGENPGQMEELLKKEFEARKIAEKLFKGEYIFDGKGEKGVLGSLKSQAVRNETYLPKDWESLAQKVSSLLPAEQVQDSRQKARAR